MMIPNCQRIALLFARPTTNHVHRHHQERAAGPAAAAVVLVDDRGDATGEPTGEPGPELPEDDAEEAAAASLRPPPRPRPCLPPPRFGDCCCCCFRSAPAAPAPAPVLEASLPPFTGCRLSSCGPTTKEQVVPADRHSRMRTHGASRAGAQEIVVGLQLIATRAVCDSERPNTTQWDERAWRKSGVKDDTELLTCTASWCRRTRCRAPRLKHTRTNALAQLSVPPAPNATREGSSSTAPFATGREVTMESTAPSCTQTQLGAHEWLK